MYSDGIYKGEYPSKMLTRSFVWRQHQRLLKRAFKTTPHVFLASRVAGDVDTLRDLGVPGHNIWAVEKDREQYEPLLERYKREGFRLFPQKVETLMSARAAEVRSVYLDYCGNLQGTARTTRRVVATLPEGSAVSVTLFLGREHERPGDREAGLLQQFRESTAHQVTLVQSISYLSYHSADGPFGTPMGTWTFYLGPLMSRSKMRFDLYSNTNAEIQGLASTPGAAAELWAAHLKRAEARCLAARKANQARV